MRKVTQLTATAFERGQTKQVNNTRTDGTALFLHGNKIAEKREDGLYITLAGWNTPTTRERLNGLSGVSVCVKRGQPYLNGQPWNGEWIKVN